MSDDREKCAEQVTPKGGWYTSRRCSRWAKKDGYCNQHHPDTVRAKDAESQRKFDDRMKARHAPHDLVRKYKEVVRQVRLLASNAILEGRQVRPVAIQKLLEVLDD